MNIPQNRIAIYACKPYGDELSSNITIKYGNYQKNIQLYNDFHTLIIDKLV